MRGLFVLTIGVSSYLTCPNTSCECRVRFELSVTDGGQTF